MTNEEIFALIPDAEQQAIRLELSLRSLSARGVIATVETDPTRPLAQGQYGLKVNYRLAPRIYRPLMAAAEKEKQHGK